MIQEIKNEIMQKMLSVLDNYQLEQLSEVLDIAFFGITAVSCDKTEEDSNDMIVGSFISSKRIEGCSEKSLKYYQKTITNMLGAVGKQVKHIDTDDLRKYLTSYQEDNNSSRVTIDNIRRILSSFFSWLEEENYIMKSPVRRIHKIKTASTIKDTYTDEALEQMRDDCSELRDLALIDILASTGMRVGELVLLNRSDIDSFPNFSSKFDFYDQSHFVHSFKEFTGVAPKEYLNQVKKSSYKTKVIDFN